MKEKLPGRDRKVTVRFTETEYQKLKKSWENSLCPGMSDYLRNVAFSKPVIAKYRNQSLDDFMAEMIILRAELNHIGNNFNQAVKRLHTLRTSPEFDRWLTIWDGHKSAMENKMEEIRERIQLIAESWLRS